MMFDNSPPPSPSTWSAVKAHLPILLAVGGLLVGFVALHVAAIGVAVAAGLHLLAGLVIAAAARHRRGDSAAS